MHETYAFGFVEAGHQAFSCRGTQFHSTSGSIFAINPGDAHDGEPAGTLGFRYRMIYVAPAAFSAAVDDDGADAPLFRSAMFYDNEVARLLIAAHDSLTEGDGKLERAERLGAFIQTMAHRHGLADGPRGRPAPARSALERVRDYMHSHFREDLSLDRLASVADLGRHHLSRTFSNAYGLAPHRYLTHLRLAEGRKRLRDGNAIADVAVAVGFSDQSHFHRRFKRAFGVTPSQFQRAVTNVQ
jgi:AraC-like DNA-binding protein